MTAMGALDPLVDRIARAQHDARERSERLRALVPEMSTVLRDRGAKRVWLFGSLATGAVPHAGTDVDLCVEGVEEAAVPDLTLALEELARARVDLVRWEAASARLRSRVLRDGLEIGA
jgi:predicted nucleotidyltransferase